MILNLRKANRKRNLSIARSGNVAAITLFFLFFFLLILFLCHFAGDRGLYEGCRGGGGGLGCNLAECLCQILHYENTPIQLYWKIYHQKMKIFR